VQIWTGTQFQTVDQANAARAAGLRPEQVEINTLFLGGGFGRRATPSSDFIVEAVHVAKAAGAPVKTMWTREDDLRGGYYRPMWSSALSAGLDASGRPVAWKHTIVGQSVTEGTVFAGATMKDGVDQTSVEGAAELPYTVPPSPSIFTARSPWCRCSGGAPSGTPIPASWWRASWTSWRRPPARIPTSSAASC
jgi:isoquinoline 1-oxidoreductase beta subunit